MRPDIAQPGGRAAALHKHVGQRRPRGIVTDVVLQPGDALELDADEGHGHPDIQIIRHAHRARDHQGRRRQRKTRMSRQGARPGHEGSRSHVVERNRAELGVIR